MLFYISIVFNRIHSRRGDYRRYRLKNAFVITFNDFRAISLFNFEILFLCFTGLLRVVPKCLCLPQNSVFSSFFTVLEGFQAVKRRSADSSALLFRIFLGNNVPRGTLFLICFYNVLSDYCCVFYKNFYSGYYLLFSSCFILFFFVFFIFAFIINFLLFWSFFAIQQ